MIDWRNILLYVEVFALSSILVGIMSIATVPNVGMFLIGAGIIILAIAIVIEWRRENRW